MGAEVFAEVTASVSSSWPTSNCNVRCFLRKCKDFVRKGEANVSDGCPFALHQLLGRRDKHSSEASERE
jgi:hypothetical protein